MQELANRQNQLLQRQQELQLQTDTENSSVHAIWENGIQSDLETEDWLADQRDESMVTEETGKAIYTYEIADGITTSLARASLIIFFRSTFHTSTSTMIVAIKTAIQQSHVIHV